ncbi:MAG TPA: hypothetical protein VM451_06670 [Candidatus Limnocylindria bacterium]|nr:hypothetical protein [Candidatus Limnocylindria bacterium]
MSRARAVASIIPQLVLALATALVLAACSTGTIEPSGPGRTSAATVAPATDEPAGTLDPSLPSQSETDWGPIWDTVPANFPVMEGAEPAEAASPASAAYTVARSVRAPKAIADFYQAGFAAKSLGGGVDGPLEDGSYTSWGSGGYGCYVVVTVAPRGAESLVTVFYGADCDFDWPVPEG